jgi:hypothetical protein
MIFEINTKTKQISIFGSVEVKELLETLRNTVKDYDSYNVVMTTKDVNYVPTWPYNWSYTYPRVWWSSGIGTTTVPSIPCTTSNYVNSNLSSMAANAETLTTASYLNDNLVWKEISPKNE